ncbi:MAG TPA: cation:proton antiporter [Vicinamibacteria bacterium]|nr:cation:proton antiporter [Vicinamibacteria bacterium]
MAHEAPLVTTVAAALGAAWLLGMAAHRLGLSPIVGYLLAGLAIGPYTPGFVGDVALATQLAEIGVVLLLFGVGLHFHPRDLLAVRAVAIPGALVQVAVVTVLGALVGRAVGWPLAGAILFGIALSVSSTVVMVRALEERDLQGSAAGHVGIGWLIVQDVVTVLVLVIVPALGERAPGAPGLLAATGMAVLKVAVLAALVLFAGSRLVPRLLHAAARMRSRELFTLSVLAVAMAVATGAAQLFGVSMALGAFLAGMVVGQTRLSEQAAADALPLRDAFAVLFFVSIGMLFDPRFAVREPLLVAAAVGVVLVGKSLVSLAMVALLGYSTRTALLVALGLAQVGEFSFILADLSRAVGLLTDDARHVLVACAIVTIALNPILLRQADPMEAALRRSPRLLAMLEGPSRRRRDATNALATTAAARLERPAIVVGYGPVGQAVDGILREAGLSTVIVDLNVDAVSELVAAGRTAIYGDATQAEVLRQAGVARASHLVITLPHSTNRRPLMAAARALNPRVRIIVRARYLREREDLEQAGADVACFEEAEAAVVLASHVLEEVGADGETISREVARVRREVGGLAL